MSDLDIFYTPGRVIETEIETTLDFYTARQTLLELHSSLKQMVTFLMLKQLLSENYAVIGDEMCWRRVFGDSVEEGEIERLMEQGAMVRDAMRKLKKALEALRNDNQQKSGHTLVSTEGQKKTLDGRDAEASNSDAQLGSETVPEPKPCGGDDGDASSGGAQAGSTAMPKPTPSGEDAGQASNGDVQPSSETVPELELSTHSDRSRLDNGEQYEQDPGPPDDTECQSDTSASYGIDTFAGSRIDTCASEGGVANTGEGKGVCVFSTLARCLALVLSFLLLGIQVPSSASTLSATTMSSLTPILPDWIFDVRNASTATAKEDYDSVHQLLVHLQQGGFVQDGLFLNSTLPAPLTIAQSMRVQLAQPLAQISAQLIKQQQLLHSKRPPLGQRLADTVVEALAPSVHTHAPPMYPIRPLSCPLLCYAVPQRWWWCTCLTSLARPTPTPTSTVVNRLRSEGKAAQREHRRRAKQAFWIRQAMSAEKVTNAAHADMSHAIGRAAAVVEREALAAVQEIEELVEAWVE